MRLGERVTGALLLGALVVLVHTLISELSTARDGGLAGLPVSLALLSPLLGLWLAALFCVSRCREERAFSRVALGVVAVTLVLRLGWVLVFDSYQVSDFGSYLHCGEELASRERAEGAFCEGLYLKRALFYTFPIVFLFGKSLMAVELVNVALLSVTAWIFFLIGRRIFGARVATLGLLFFVSNPELWYSVTLASHDIPAVFWLAIFFALFTLLRRSLLGPDASLPRLLSLSLGLGLAIFFLDFSRSWHESALVSLAIYATLHCTRLLLARPARLTIVIVHASLLLFIPLSTHRLSEQTFWAHYGIGTGERRIDLVCYLSAVDILGSNRASELNGWHREQCPRVPPEERNAYALRKALHEFTHSPGEFFRYLQRKNTALAREDGYLGFSTYAAPSSRDTTAPQVRRVNRGLPEEQRRAIALAHSILLLLVIGRLLLFRARPFPREVLFVHLFSLSFYAALLVLLANQPRYDLFLVFSFSWMGAETLGHFSSPREERRPDPTPRMYLSGAALLSALALAYVGVARLLADGPLTLRDQSGFASVASPLVVRSDFRRVRLGYPAGAAIDAGTIATVERTFRVGEQAPHRLRFFLAAAPPKTPPAAGGRPDVEIEYQVTVNDQLVTRGKLSEIPGQLYVSRSPEDGIVFARAMTLRLSLRNLTRIERVDPERGPVLSLEYIDLR